MRCIKCYVQITDDSLGNLQDRAMFDLTGLCDSCSRELYQDNYSDHRITAIAAKTLAKGGSNEKK